MWGNMIIYKNKDLTEAIKLGDECNLDLGTCMAGSKKTFEYYLHNDKDCDILDLHLTLFPVIETKDGKERDYSQCLQEITLSPLLKKMKPNETQLLEITYEPSISYFRSLKVGFEISYSELPL